MLFGEGHAFRSRHARRVGWSIAVDASISLLGEQPEMGRQTSREGVYVMVVETSTTPFTEYWRREARCGFFVCETVAGGHKNGNVQAKERELKHEEQRQTLRPGKPAPAFTASD